MRFSENPSLAELRRVFTTLEEPADHLCRGFFSASFVGPGWLRKIAPVSVSLMGLPGWTGKRFLSDERAINVLRQEEQTRDAIPMVIRREPSLIDGQPVLALVYTLPDSPWPLCWFRDELRTLDERTLLGMTLVDKPLLRYMAFPFLLERQDD